MPEAYRQGSGGAEPVGQGTGPGACLCAGVDRRTVLKGVAVAGLGLAGGPALAEDDPAKALPQPGDLLVRAGDAAKKPLTPADIPAAQRAVEAWAMEPASGVVRSGSLGNRVILFRFDAAALTPAAQKNAADGVIALTIICTHAGCEVTDWVEDIQVLECPCHFSRFDPRNNGEVVQGPATRHLPVLAVKIDDGRLMVAKAFDSKIGGDTN